MANYHPQSYVARALRWVRKWADEPAGADAKYTDDEMALLLGASLDQVLTDLYGNTMAPPYATHTITTVALQADYKIPANAGEILRIGKLDSQLQTYQWEILPRGRYHPAGAGFLPIGTHSIRLIPTPSSGGDELTLEYIPNGMIPLHQNAAPLRVAGNLTITTTTFRLNPTTGTNWYLGRFDRRPNAFIGCMLRILGTTHDVTPAMTSGSGTTPFFPIQERRISSYDLYNNATVTVSQPFDLVDWTLLVDNDTLGQPGDPQTYLVYEIVPDVDPAVLWLAAVNMAYQIVTTEEKVQKEQLLEKLYNKQKRSAQLRWANIEQRRGHQMTKDPTTSNYWDAWEM